jgi:hypothetical protein
MAETGNTKVVKNDLLEENQTSSDYYYNSYAHFSIHEVNPIDTRDHNRL